jgi:hypothetical protein
MFERFEASYSRDLSEQQGKSGRDIIPNQLPGLSQFFSDYGGASFKNGLYRVIRPSDLSQWQARLELAFPNFSGRVVCFAYDWAGDIFALNTERLEDGQAGVTLFEPGMNEVLQIPSNLKTFHERVLIESGEAALSIDFYKKWKASGGSAPLYDQCIGYQKPLFLSGIDDVANLEVSDIDVYWRMMGQLIEQTRGLPPGTPVQVSLV